MKNIASYIVGATLGLSSLNAHTAINPNPPAHLASKTVGPDQEKICEGQALAITRELLPIIQRRVLTTLAGSLDSIEVKFQPDPNWPAQYVQSQVSYYLDGETEENETGKFSLEFQNPFLDFSLRYWKEGRYRMNATCKYPIKK